ncbi:hypothetical protein [Flaviflagellibacter deserti]|uniref:PD-(D/E)XK nuclease superfamily protein n=1 Tax=Flaviflagellibacter deserti TaxID=2267266 RepID=A0ABV9YZ26_9HYPH
MITKGRPVLIGETAQLLQREELTGSDGQFREEWLQNLIFEHPACIPMHEIEPGFPELLSICKELPTAHGNIDILFMTVNGDLVLAETKLWRNPQARREVVAQALDYASCLFGMGYIEFQAAIAKATGDPDDLYSRIANLPDAPSEAAFVDAVSHNLRRGRIVLLLIGDGIRAETERLVEVLQSHAGFHFTFALIELAVYLVPAYGRLVVPRTLAKTTMIERGIVRFSEANGLEVLPVPSLQSHKTSGITEEQFFDAIAKRGADLPALLKTFLAELEPLGVRPEFRKSLVLRWDPPEGKSINLGYIMQDGQIWTDATSWTSPSLSIAQRYVEVLAKEWGMQVDKERMSSGIWTIRVGGKAPRIEMVANRLSGWVTAIESFIGEVRTFIAERGISSDPVS